MTIAIYSQSFCRKSVVQSRLGLGLVYRATHVMLCVLILYVSGGTYSLMSTPKDRFFEKLLQTLLSKFLPEIF